MIETDIQAGTTLEVTAPLDADTTVRVTAAPPGVTAAVVEDRGAGSILLTVAVDPDTPRGAYGLGLVATRNGDEYELRWPFDVVEPTATGSEADGGTGTVAPASSTPEVLRDRLVAAVEARDADVLLSLWPASSWEPLGRDVLATFVPSADRGPCDRMSDTSANCFVFAQDAPFVLGLTMEDRGASGWIVTAVGFDSTD